MEEIQYDSNNYRIHGNKNKQLIKNSLSDLGAGRSVLLDNDNVLIAGNGVYEQASELGLKVRIIESDGTELIAIKRTDLSTSDEKRKLLAIADNKTSDTSEFDFDLLASDFELGELEDLGFEKIDFGMGEINMLDDMEVNAFSNSIKEDSETFDFTLSLPKEKREEVEQYVKVNTKVPLVELILNHIGNA